MHALPAQRGTLTAEERDVINYHITATIKMLESLPFPKDLLRVPEFAGGHHEKMDGTGYPRGLKREDMSVQARIMGIADIFEALTAADRPYKQAKTLSASLKIMGFMKKDNHIDPDLFEKSSKRDRPGLPDDDPSTWRRSLYVYSKRSIRYPMFESFDQPNLVNSVDRRNRSTVAPQALILMTFGSRQKLCISCSKPQASSHCWPFSQALFVGF